MIVKGRGSVTMPKLPRAIGNLLGYAKEVNQALQQLADRAYDIPTPHPPKPATQLPFQVSASISSLQAAPGVIGSTTVSDDSDLKVSSPANGNHYLIAKVVINATTGAITSEEVYWDTSFPSNTTTDFYSLIAYVELTAGEITTAEQYNYGPIYVIVGGGATDIWTVVTY